MTALLIAEFEKRFVNGPSIGALLRVPREPCAITVLFGPSGAGKTTVLRSLAGLERPDEGRIEFDGAAWFDAARNVCLPPQQRGIGYLFQDYALFPHLRVAGNIDYGLGGLTAAARRARVEQMLKSFGLTALAERWPRHLSGGEHQRTALARALAPKPRLLLLDEPLSALDAPTRLLLRRELRHWLVAAQTPAVVVTHDRVEAIALGDTIVVMDEGRVCQTGSVEEVFSRPANLAVAHIVGVETVVPARVLSVTNGLAAVAVAGTQLSAVAEGMDIGNCFVCIRAEEVIVETTVHSSTSARNHLPGHVVSLHREGPLVRVQLDCGFSLSALVTYQSCQELSLCEGAQVTALVKAPAVHLIARNDC